MLSLKFYYRITRINWPWCWHKKDINDAKNCVHRNKSMQTSTVFNTISLTYLFLLKKKQKNKTGNRVYPYRKLYKTILYSYSDMTEPDFCVWIMSYPPKWWRYVSIYWFYFLWIYTNKSKLLLVWHLYSWHLRIIIECFRMTLLIWSPKHISQCFSLL